MEEGYDVLRAVLGVLVGHVETIDESLTSPKNRLNIVVVT